MADLSFKVCPVGADAAGTARPSLVVWVGGDETIADESEQLAAIGAPGLSIGTCVDGPADWSYLEPDELDDRDRFTRQFVSIVGALLGAPGRPDHLGRELI